MKNQILIVVLVLSCLNNSILAQESNSSIKVKTRNLISKEAFDKLAFSDLNFLILGNESPKQGVEFELKEKKTSLKISGLLKSFNRSFLTIDGEFTVDDGVYFFDENNGSKQSRFTLNFFHSLHSSRKYDPINSGENESSKAKLAYLNAKLSSIDAVSKALDKYETVRIQMVKLKLPYDVNYLSSKIADLSEELDYKFTPKAIPERKDEVKEGINEIRIEVGEIKKELKRLNSNNEIIIANNPKNEKINANTNVLDFKVVNDDEKLVWSYKVDDIASTIKLLNEYESAKNAIDSLEEKIYNKEIEIAKEVWNSKLILYYGLSGFYQRESVTIYNYQTDTEFKNLFDDTTGDVYGLTASFNIFKQWNTDYWRGLKNKDQKGKDDTSMLYGRIIGSLGRGSNISSFTKSKIALETPTGEEINGYPITILNSKDGYIGTSDYSYGLRSTLDMEFYAIVYEGLGLFGRVGYSSLNFADDKAAKSNEKYPMRLGLLFNLKGKDKTKNALAFQVFLDRTNLKLDPNGQDKDLRFGFSVGLPINLKSNL